MNAREQFVFLDALAAILIRCFFLAVAVLLLCFVFFILAGDYGYYLGSLWFDIDEYDYTPVSYTHLTLPTIYSV